MSNAAPSEAVVLDNVWTSRLVFLSYRVAQGIYFSFAQQQAIILGDVSGSFIHPFFIKFAHLVGCHFHRRYCSGDGLIQLETSHLFSVLRTLSSMKEEADPLSYVHSHWLVAMACVTTGNSQKAVNFMKEAANAVERNRDLFLSKLPGLSIVPITATVDYSEDLHERLGLLAHILWFRTYMSIYLVDSGVYPMPDDAPDKISVSVSLDCTVLPLTQGLSNRFWRSSKTISMVRRVASFPALLIYFKITCRSVASLVRGAAHLQLSQIACPVLFEVCPLMVRVRTMLLIRKSRKLIAQYMSERKHTYAFKKMLIHCSCRDSNASLVDTVLRGLHRTWRTGTNCSQVDYKIFGSK